MANSYFQFKQFIIHQDKCAMKVTTDSCLFGAWVADKIKKEQLIINNCLDIGTGSGLLSLMLAQTNLTIECDGIEIDTAAAAQAQNNADNTPWKDKICIIPGDAKDIAYVFEKKYDVIISNPPFYENDLTSPNSQRNYAHHNSGLLLKDLLMIIKDLLLLTGRFYLLLPFKRNEEIKNLFSEKGLHLEQLMLVRQSVNHDYFRIMIQGKLRAEELNEPPINEMSIKDAEGKYTPQFITLLKDYYLHV